MRQNLPIATPFKPRLNSCIPLGSENITFSERSRSRGTTGGSESQRMTSRPWQEYDVSRVRNSFWKFTYSEEPVHSRFRILPLDRNVSPHN